MKSPENLTLGKFKRFSLFFYNPISYAGAYLALLCFLVEIFLFTVDFLSHEGNLYLGLLTYCVIPPFLGLGLILIPIGALRKRSQVLKGRIALEPKPIRIDLSIPHHRNMVLTFIVGTFILVVMSLVGAYKGFQYTESVEFCGVLCHDVMHPEYTAYKNSPHGKVSCVECHIGEGATWYVRSKMSGARQVVKALTNTYEKPIKTPVPNLRPAEETCTECHWPGKFFGSKDRDRTYYLTQGENPAWKIRMLLKVGGSKGNKESIHSHMNIDHTIFYVAEDDKRQIIPWVKSVDKNGKETIYTTSSSPYKDKEPPAHLIRKMDCIDCHNRPTHRFGAPTKLLNDALSSGQIDPGIPEIKLKAVEWMSRPYPSQKEALLSISKEVLTYYKENHTDYFSENEEKIRQAADEIVRLYSQNIFPDMKTRWDTSPDNIGHLISDGCHRCHDDSHKSPEGKLITRDCNSCHTVIEQGPLGATEKNLDGLEFKHPVDIEDVWKDMACTECHSGAGAEA